MVISVACEKALLALQNYKSVLRSNEKLDQSDNDKQPVLNFKIQKTASSEIKRILRHHSFNFIPKQQQQLTTCLEEAKEAKA